MSIVLRDYQERAVGSVFDWWREKRPGNPLLVCPTGSGKSVILAEVIRRCLAGWPSMRIGVITHQQELIEQDFQALVRVWPQAPVGIFSAAIGRKDRCAQVMFAGVQSIYNKLNWTGAFDLIIIDEVHLVPRQSKNGMYTQLLRDNDAMNPSNRILGLTATPYRLDSGRLDEGEDSWFGGVCYDINVGDLISQGHLTRPITKRTATGLDVSKVSIRGGEFVAAELDAAVDQDAINKAVVNEIVASSVGRRGIITFGTSIKHCEHLATLLTDQGVPTKVVHGQMSKSERSRLLSDFKAQRIKSLASVAILTTGFDAPHVDLLAMVRPTASPGLYSQMIGRGLRLYPGKEDCLVLDFARLIERHGPIDDITPPPTRKKRKRKAEDQPIDLAASKCCPECQTVLAARRMVCDCGYAFPVNMADKIDTTASDRAILSIDEQVNWLPCTDMVPHYHTKVGKPDSVRVDYYVGLSKPVAFFLTVGHFGPPRMRAEQWWSRHGGGVCPRTAGEAIARWAELKKPTAIAVAKNGKWQEVSRISFAPLATLLGEGHDEAA